MGIFNSNKRGAISVRPISTPVLNLPLQSFKGINNSSNVLNQPFGQLSVNFNMEYKVSGDNVYLETKRGSSLIKDITRESFGASMYTYDYTNERYAWVDGSNIRIINTDGSNEITINAGLEANKCTSFVMYGEGDNAALFGVNGEHNEVGKGYFKITGETPVITHLESPQLKDIIFSTLLGRMIGVHDHSIHFSEVQLGQFTENLESFVKDAIVSPDDGQGFNKLIDMGSDGIYFFKDSGIWVLPNGNETDPLDWRFPKVGSDVGTLSPRTVERVNYGGVSGIIFLASDKTLRFFSPKLEYNAGSLPSVVKPETRLISNSFQSLLNSIPTNQLEKCTAKYWQGLYILNIPKDAGSSDIDRTIVIDTQKLIKTKADKVAQPYWFESENMDFKQMIIKPSTNDLIGFNKNGYIAEMFVDYKFVEEMPNRIDVSQEYVDDGSLRSVAIEYKSYLAWYDYSKKISNGAELEFTRAYLHWSPKGNHGIGFSLNAFVRGESIPFTENGLKGLMKAPETSGGIFGQSIFNTSYFGADNTGSSQNVRLRNKGHYFLYGFYSTKYNEAASIYGLDPLFKVTRRDAIGKR